MREARQPESGEGDPIGAHWLEAYHPVTMQRHYPTRHAAAAVLAQGPVWYAQLGTQGPEPSDQNHHTESNGSCGADGLYGHRYPLSVPTQGNCPCEERSSVVFEIAADPGRPALLAIQR